jgi:hypothetical protein
MCELHSTSVCLSALDSQLGPDTVATHYGTLRPDIAIYPGLFALVNAMALGSFQSSFAPQSNVLAAISLTRIPALISASVRAGWLSALCCSVAHSVQLAVWWASLGKRLLDWKQQCGEEKRERARRG